MSKGLTPYEFVQQVYYVQEKVLLDFLPPDDKFKEVLTEANMVIQELQKEEDWLWLRQPRVLGITDHKPHPMLRWFPWHRHIAPERLKLKLTEDIYKPSTLYGDGVRLHRYHFNEEFVVRVNAYFKYWLDRFKYDEYLEPDMTLAYDSEVGIEEHIKASEFTYGGTFPYSLRDKSYEDIRKLISIGKWYIDIDGKLYIGSSSFHVEGKEQVEDPWNVPRLIYVLHEPDYPFPEKPPVPGFKPDEKPDKKPRPDILWNDELEGFYENITIHEFDYIKVPYVSAGNLYRHNKQQVNRVLRNDTHMHDLGCVVVGDHIEFTRPLIPFEHGRVVVMDAQIRIKPFHVCSHTCTGHVQALGGEPAEIDYPYNPCHEAWKQEQSRMLTEVPDPNYVVVKTAQYHAQGSPTAQGIIPNLQDQAQKILSSMRSNNAAATAPDYIDWDTIDFINVV